MIVCFFFELYLLFMNCFSTTYNPPLTYLPTKVGVFLR